MKLRFQTNITIVLLLTRYELLIRQLQWFALLRDSMRCNAMILNIKFVLL